MTIRELMTLLADDSVDWDAEVLVTLFNDDHVEYPIRALETYRRDGQRYCFLVSG